MTIFLLRKVGFKAHYSYTSFDQKMRNLLYDWLQIFDLQSRLVLVMLKLGLLQRKSMLRVFFLFLANSSTIFCCLRNYYYDKEPAAMQE